MQPPAVPSAKQRLLRSLLAWALGALGAWGLQVATAALLPVTATQFWNWPWSGSATDAVAMACCATPIVVGGLLFYVVLRQCDLRRPLWTGPLFACCFVVTFVCPGGHDMDHVLNSMLATVAAALLALGEALARRSSRDVVTAVLMLVVALAEIVGLWALQSTAGC